MSGSYKEFYLEAVDLLVNEVIKLKDALKDPSKTLGFQTVIGGLLKELENAIGILTEVPNTPILKNYKSAVIIIRAYREKNLGIFPAEKDLHLRYAAERLEDLAAENARKKNSPQATSALKTELQAAFKGRKNDSRLDMDLHSWVGDNVIPNILNVPSLECYTDSHGNQHHRIIKLNPKKDWSKFTIETEEVDFENFYLTDVNFSTETIILTAGGDWQDPYTFSVTRRADGKYIYNNDIRKEENGENFIHELRDIL